MKSIMILLALMLPFTSCQRTAPACDPTSMTFSGENPITLKASFIGCACGLDYPQYHVDSVFSSENVPAEYYRNKEISLMYKDTVLEKKLALPDCDTRCFHHILSGMMERNGYGMHRLTVSEGQIVIKEGCCN